jgi:hypothetical protein
MAWPILLVLLFVWPRTANADAGVPMIAVLWPWAWAAFIPVCLIEALVAKRLLSLPLRQCARLSVVANAWSTLVGIPLTWLALFLVEMGGGLGLWVSGAEPGPVWTAVLSPIDAPWLGPQARPWHVFAAAAILCIPFLFVSIRIERWSAAKNVPFEAARRWAVIANLATYIPIIAFLVAIAISRRLHSP